MAKQIAVNMNKEQKIYNYQRIRVNKDNDLAWIRNVINDLWHENKITVHEGICFVDSLPLKDERIE